MSVGDSVETMSQSVRGVSRAGEDFGCTVDPIVTPELFQKSQSVRGVSRAGEGGGECLICGYEIGPFGSLNPYAGLAAPGRRMASEMRATSIATVSIRTRG
jgi:hypothetical protein